MYAHIKERMPVELAGTAMTGINFFTMIGVAVFLQGLGNMMQFFHPGESLGISAHLRIHFYSAQPVFWSPLLCYCFSLETLRPMGRSEKTPL